MPEHWKYFFAFPESILQQYRHTLGIWKVPTLELVKCLEEVRDVIRTGRKDVWKIVKVGK